ncbi:MAG: phenylacetate--CoA ligase family protein [Deltaproteobacteria bacterium]|nr:phenylacetate--CoA ligase family protein [Deltaproteobacteria bacterium]
MPILTKDIIRREGKQLISERPQGKVRWNASGGSTGEPIRLLQDRNMMYHSRATELLFMRWAGHRMGEPHVLIWGVPVASSGERISLHDRIYSRIHNETYLNCHEIDDKVVQKWIDGINTRRPTLIEAYADAIYELSRCINSNGLDVVGPRAIIASAAVLTPSMRETIKKAFSCPVLNRYGSREVGAVACSCSSNNELHVEEYTCYIEIVDDEGIPCEVGVEGNILVTLLTNNVMPLIRYRIEDRGAWATGPCSCGRTTRRLASVNGRQFDFLLTADGRKIHAGPFCTALYSVSSIRRYQYRQTDKTHITLAVVPAAGYDKEAIIKDMRLPLQRVGMLVPGVTVELTIVDDIIPSKSGKYRFVLNEVINR